VRCHQPYCARTLFLIGAGWFLVALFVGETELLTVLPSIAPQIIAATLSALVVGGYCFSANLRIAVDSWSIRTMVGVHLVRFVGLYFLFLAAHRELDPRFAIPAGWGDAAIAVGAVLLLISRVPNWALLLWNTLGLLDILFVLAQAARLQLSDPDALGPLTRLPLSFLPTLIVPLIIATHVVIFIRILRRSSAKSIPHSELEFASARGNADTRCHVEI
jgi:hypothetical protein